MDGLSFIVLNISYELVVSFNCNHVVAISVNMTEVVNAEIGVN